MAAMMACFGNSLAVTLSGDLSLFLWHEKAIILLMGPTILIVNELKKAFERLRLGAGMRLLVFHSSGVI